jgi:ubiquitin carboxyl-terminal hydrolase 4/11/15
MTATTTTPPPDSDAAAATPTAVPLDPASYLGPSNPISRKPPSRSQSPAKRLKSEEPPSTTVEASLDGAPAISEPMDEDARARDVSVDMADAATADAPETAEAVDSSAGSSTAATATQPSTAPTSTATSIVTSPPPAVEEQIKMLLAANNTPLVDGGIYYVIASVWVKRFIAQSHEAAAEAQIDLKEVSEQELGPIDNTSIVDTEQLAELERKKLEDRMFAPTLGSDNGDWKH